jgi:hypothetical protein
VPLHFGHFKYSGKEVTVSSSPSKGLIFCVGRFGDVGGVSLTSAVALSSSGEDGGDGVASIFGIELDRCNPTFLELDLRKMGGLFLEDSSAVLSGNW